MRNPFRPQYTPILDADAEASAAFPPTHDPHDRAARGSQEKLLPQRTPLTIYIRWPTPWIISTLLFATLSLILALRPLALPQPEWASFTYGFPTDFADARAAIEVEQRRFSGELAFNASNGHIERVIDPSEPQYFGAPSADLDAAWDTLLGGHWVAMTDAEAAPWSDQLKRQHTGHYHMVLDMYHSLHCLNAIRKTIDKEYYANDPDINHGPAAPEGFERIHIDHCLDQMRHTIECGGDLSPVPFFNHPDFKFAIGIGQTHTCRVPSKMRAWMDKRNRIMSPL